jgi:Heterokaryon incompatibility protein (HET)
VEPETSSTLSLDLAHKWYLSCRASHRRCGRLASKAQYPSRLLDIGVEGDSKWKLRITSQDTLLSPIYMTLSYRWGPTPGFMLLNSNIKECCRGKFICDLPRTFRDSIAVTRWFSIRYLWIDSLCIIQDSQEDWKRESLDMRNVYANSSCNIAASASTDPDGGLFRSRNPKEIQPGVIRTNLVGSGPKDYYIFDKSYSGRQVSNEPLHKRGWVFQECLLPSRVLYFTRKQIFWECLTVHKCEGFPLGIPHYYPLKNLDPLFEGVDSNCMRQNLSSLDIFNLWNDLVEAYTRCAFTKPSDKLVAFSGLARLFQDLTRDEYVAGLWRSCLLEHLDWRVYEPAARLIPDYRAPSWSWACLDGPVRPHGISAATSQHLSIVDVQVKVTDFGDTGQVSSGYIVVRGSLVQATCCDTHHRGAGRQLKTGAHNVTVHLWEDVLGTYFEDGTKIWCLSMNSSSITNKELEDSREEPVLTGLILELQQKSPNFYRRVGHFNVYGGNDIQKFGFCIKDGSGVLSETAQLSTITIL